MKGLYRIVFSFLRFLAPKLGESEAVMNHKANLEEEGRISARLGGRLITNQGSLDGFRYGEALLSKSGCEAIAIYNALMIKGRARSLSDIVLDLEYNNLLINRGKWGTDPFAMRRALQSYGLETETISNPDEAERKMQNGDMLLVTIWNHGRRPFQGIHGYLIYKNEDGLWTINKNYLPRAERVETIRDAIGEGRYIIGYLIR